MADPSQRVAVNPADDCLGCCLDETERRLTPGRSGEVPARPGMMVVVTLRCPVCDRSYRAGYGTLSPGEGDRES